MANVVYFCSTCRREESRPKSDEPLELCPACYQRTVAAIPTAPGHLAHRAGSFTYKQVDVVPGRITVDVPSKQGVDLGAERKVQLLKEGLHRAIDAADQCTHAISDNTPLAQQLFESWFHNPCHKHSARTSANPRWKWRVREVFANVHNALQQRKITFALATPDNAWAQADPNSPAFAWPPNFNQVVAQNMRAAEATTEVAYKEAVAGLSSFNTGSAIRVVITDFFFTYDVVGRASTIVHELSHKTSDTLDMAYGPWQCHELAVDHPYKAIANADNYTIFAEQVMGRTWQQVFTWQGTFTPPE